MELKMELFSKKKRTRDGFHKQPWLVEHWPEYIERTFEKAPDHIGPLSQTTAPFY